MTRTAKSVSIAATVVTALSLTSCGGSGGDQAAADAKQTLTVWAMGEEATRLQTLAKEFTGEHPNITVKVTPVGWDVVHQKLVSGAAAGTLPDMAQMGSTMMGEFIELDTLEPVDDKAFKKDDFFPATWDGNVVDGKAYGVPWYADARALYYRTDLAEKAGFDKAPATWKDLRDLAAAYKNKGGAEWGLDLQPGSTGAWQGWVPFLYATGGELLGEDGKPALDSPETVRALAEFGHYFDAGLAKKNFVPGHDVLKDFAADRVPMFQSGPWMVQNIAEQQPQLDGKWKVAPLPADKSSTSWVGGSSLVTFKDSEHKAAAQEFTTFLTTAKTQAKWYEISKTLPANKAAWDEPALKAGGESLAVFRKSLDTAKEIPPMATWNEFSVQIEDALEKVARGADPAATAKKLQQSTEGLVG
ncbi:MULTISPECIES: extracellular solute-binding protein [Streptomyces]|uniref:Extracellular solute-binding protein n=1 Tax=Streptomyces pratisoli TaxID=3139917 RepID=A0ACC6QB08_9ACTN|nr:MULTISPECIES: extracellular solute-binding protein [unclassified Streptomyces]MCX4510763.1 extracellular solute-binding protein [Streptomyces sp. NBC_01619]